MWLSLSQLSTVWFAIALVMGEWTNYQGLRVSLSFRALIGWSGNTLTSSRCLSMAYWRWWMVTQRVPNFEGHTGRNAPLSASSNAPLDAFVCIFQARRSKNCNQSISHKSTGYYGQTVFHIITGLLWRNSYASHSYVFTLWIWNQWSSRSP